MPGRGTDLGVATAADRGAEVDRLLPRVRVAPLPTGGFFHYLYHRYFECNYGEVDFDYTAPAGLVAAQLRRSLAAFPDAGPALQPDPARLAECRAWLDTLGAGPKIGISWTSGTVDDVRSLNYTRLADWKDLFAIEGRSPAARSWSDPAPHARPRSARRS